MYSTGNQRRGTGRTMQRRTAAQWRAKHRHDAEFEQERLEMLVHRFRKESITEPLQMEWFIESLLHTSHCLAVHLREAAV